MRHLSFEVQPFLSSAGKPVATVAASYPPPDANTYCPTNAKFHTRSERSLNGTSRTVPRGTFASTTTITKRDLESVRIERG
jgi:hypothetical protein